MTKLADLVTVFYDDGVCVVLDIRKDLPNIKDSLICLGYFYGNETRIRVTKGVHHEITIWYDGDKDPCVFGYRYDYVNPKGKMIISTLMKDLKIDVRDTDSYFEIENEFC